jgi:SAM-dependent methyltransferase
VKRRDTPAVWDRQLRLQQRFIDRGDLAVLGSLPAWQRARRVLEVGCGNGGFLVHLARQFRFKQYVGIDVNERLVALAEEAGERGEVDVRHCDIYDISAREWGRFDFVIARLVVQHLPSLPRFLDRMADVIRPGGVLYVHDAHDEVTCFEPDLGIKARLTTTIAQLTSRGIGRQAVQRVEENHHDFGFRRLGSVELVYRAQTQEDKGLVHDVLRNCLELVDSMREDQTRLRDFAGRLTRWRDARESRAQIGTRICMLRRSDAGAYTLRPRARAKRKLTRAISISTP